MTKTMNISANPSQPCTFASRTSQRTDQSLQKSMSAPTQEKIQNIFPHPSKKIKTPDTQTNSTKTEKRSIDNGLQTRWTRTPAGNSVLPQLAVTCKIEAECSYQTFVQVDSEVLRNRQLRQHAKRYRKPYNDSANIKLTDMKPTFLDKIIERLTARSTSQRNEVLFFAPAHFLFFNFFAYAQNTLSFFCHAQAQHRKK